ncbi:translation elongation factor G [Candidatus Roizmanbacteria bacterium RIFOXYB2_FULL_41_10]|uniref:Elongation factor G n=1 Tax=Candidatus Roizmanbacteria bacterium RIFOXYA1_FULL_41_12 TaxID=1802082 RepID=A0A1F7KF08_9BACT|nr:MAG: translation elongation factor G [Candidatus Roizmanbacteria bacterium RIFOXYA1_FULL_41_12]OGK68156.1 MAG: translation elongation factor G [Candidatus Roizmanbacteria bacterium RIFOXYB1_FULL_41_27]OGK69414.1 MAG: translation elongation factor G [Candidatus Roizmanbacteria bacterium RIFOXYB2_FULL_41_10]OGK71942.1 MAG: translation elongation factor G [Candidatus Roizmanbacteria bacterium RIFOXYC1_FULL_41_16]OGK75349.1 MAG: translation elongation factor G [Candidatus Roizmanbacteria bacteri
MAQQSIFTKNRQVALDKIRNIGIIAHIDAGKTTTTERILFYTGRSYKIGDIDEGTTQMDWMEQEKERGITIMSAATTTFWREVRINIIDTPGHVDFTAEVERSLRVLDGAVVIFDAEEGVQAQSETVWRQADKYKVPRLCFINKMDKLGADYEDTLIQIREKLGAVPVSITIPIGKENEFKGVIDLLSMKALLWDQDPQGIKYSTVEIPEDYQEIAKKKKATLIEIVSEHDDVLMEKFIAEQAISDEELMQGIRRATIAYKIIPIYAGTSLRNKGVQPLLNGVVDFLPSPVDLKEIEGVEPSTDKIIKRALVPEEKLCMLSFKLQLDTHVGKLTYARIYSGILKSGSYVFNPRSREKERISRILLMHANQREEIDSAYAGEIVALVGPKKAKTGDTLTEENAPIVLETIKFPEPVISLAIEPKTKADQEKLGNILQKFLEEDPTFKVKYNHETGQTVIAGMGELHLEIIVDRMRREYNMNANVGKPQVAYKETITQEAETEGKYIKQSGGRGQYGHCFLRLKPLPRGEGFKFINAIKGGAIPGEFIGSVEKGVKEALDKGVLAGYPLSDLEVTLYDGSYHDVDSSDIAFKIAGSMALTSGARKAGLTLTEPVMKMEVSTPEINMGTVIGDLSSKRAKILKTTKRGDSVTIDAYAPLAELSGYATMIRSLTQGRGFFYMEPSHYEEVPKNIQAKIVEERMGSRK